MKELRKQSIAFLTDCSDYELSLLYQIAPKFIELVSEHTERSTWVSVADTEEEKMASVIIDLLKNYKSAS